MRRTLIALCVSLLLLAACGGDDDEESGPDVDVDSPAAQEYLAELEDAGLGDVFPDDETAVRFVGTACRNAVEVGSDPETLLEEGEVNAQSKVALQYCDTELAG